MAKCESRCEMIACPDHDEILIMKFALTLASSSKHVTGLSSQHLEYAAYDNSCRIRVLFSHTKIMELKLQDCNNRCHMHILSTASAFPPPTTQSEHLLPLTQRPSTPFPSLAVSYALVAESAPDAPRPIIPA
jgi:hypothetical protein